MMTVNADGWTNQTTQIGLISSASDTALDKWWQIQHQAAEIWSCQKMKKVASWLLPTLSIQFYK